MAMSATSEEKNLRRFSRSMIAAGAAVVIAVVGAGYAVYRVQDVLKGMRLNNDTTTSLYNDGDDAWMKTGGDSDKKR